MSYHRRYKLKDDRFGLLALSLREKAGLTQTEVAHAVGVSERTIRHWEGGTAYPDPAHLKKLIEMYLLHNALVQGRERDEAKALWEQAAGSASRRKTIFDEAWFDALLKWQFHPPTQFDEYPQAPVHSPVLPHQMDWGEAIDVTSFYGRKQELAELEQWVLKDRCRVVILLGMGGIGKTTLSIKLAQQIASHFEFVFWRSLRNAPPLREIVADCIQMLSEQQYTSLPENVERSISLLIALLRKHRCLLVLDNVETLLQGGNMEGRYHEEYEDYCLMIQRVAETTHQSCLLLASREMLSELEPLVGTQSPVRTFKVRGLGRDASQQMLKDKELFGTLESWKLLIEHYSGNPLALKIITATVQDLFGGDIAAFLREEPGILHTIRQLLDAQFERLAPLERDIMYWLAIERDPISLEELSTDLISAVSRRDMLTALKSLRRRCLIERGEQGAIFTLQPVVMEYVSERLVEQVCEEIIYGNPQLLITHALMKAQSKDYLRESQVRMLLQPVLEGLHTHYNSEQAVEQQLLLLVRLLQERPSTTHGYSGGNVVNLLVCLNGHLRKRDFSTLAIRQAYLQNIEAQNAHFANTDMSDTLFSEPIESIASMTLSPDGTYLAVGSFSGQIRVWQVTDGKPFLTFTGHNRLVWALTFSPDGSILASGGYDRSVKLWRVGAEGTGYYLKTFVGHEKWVRSLAFSPDGTLLATSSDDETVRIWNVREGRCLRTLHGHTGIVWAVTFSPDGALLATSGYDGTVRVWDAQSGTCLHVLHAHSSTAMAVAFHPLGNVLASGGEEGQIKLWDVSSGHCLETLHLRTTRAASIAFNSEGTMLASGSFDGAVEVWQIGRESGNHRIRTLHGHTLWVSAVTFGPGNLLASTSYNGKVRLWNVESGRCLRTLQGYSHVISALAFSPDGKLLIHGDDNGILKLWEMGEEDSGGCLRTFRGHAGRIWSVSFSPDGKTFVSGGDDLSVKLWNVNGGEHLKTFHGHTTIIWSVVFSPDGSMLAGVGFEHAIRLWKVSTEDGEDDLTTLQGHGTFVWSLAFSPDGSLLASGDNDGEIKLWEVKSGQCLKTLRGPTSPIGALAFSPDGNRLFSSSDMIVTIWDVSSGYSFQMMQGQDGLNWIRSMAFSRDGTMLANGYNDHTVKLWQFKETSSTQAFTTFSRGGGQVWSVAFNLDGSMLASGDDEGTIVVWDIKTGIRLHTLRSERPYERMNIQGVKGLTQAQKASLKALGATEEPVEHL
jgi:WD40 repeat protein/transcriptional regulator with XRE-family HTH domain